MPSASCRRLLTSAVRLIDDFIGPASLLICRSEVIKKKNIFKWKKKKKKIHFKKEHFIFKIYKESDFSAHSVFFER